MTTPMRRPVPALIALVALLLLTALVWWRVLHRDTGGGGGAEASCPTQPSAAATLPDPSLVTLQVLNATDRSGIASKARARLIADGFDVPDPAGNDKPRVKIPEVAEIRYGPKGADAAKLVRYYFPGARMVTTKAKTATVVVSLGEKYRGVASPSAVQAELKRKNIALATTSPDEPSSSPTC